MILIGIVGALSPLGREMVMFLTNSSDYKIIWVVDEHYKADSPTESQFRDLDSAMLYQLPALVLDFGSYKSTFQRIKIYRSNGTAAIMQGILPKEEISALEEVSLDRICAPVILEPDFSIVVVQTVKNLMCQTHNLLCDVNSVQVDVQHHSDVEVVRLPWLHWAKVLNSILGETTKFPTWDNAKFNLGRVIVHNQYVQELPQDDESIKIELCLHDAKGNLEWSVACPLLQSRVEGVMLLLDWYVSQREVSQDLVLGNISTDMLSMLI